MAISYSYPTFAEFLRERYRDGKRKPADDARALRLQEQTVLGWCSGTVPNQRQRAQIVEKMGYKFVERRYAEAVADAEFPSAAAHPALQILTTYERFHEFLLALVTRMPQEGIAQAAGIPATTLCAMMRDSAHILERDALAKILRALPSIVDDCTGKTFSIRTPRSVVGQYLRKCRQQRGEEQRAYAARISIPSDTYSWIEAQGREAHEPEPGKRASFVRNIDLNERVINFLRREREQLKVTVQIDDQWMYFGASPPLAAIPSGPTSLLPQPQRALQMSVTADAVRAQLRTLVERCGSNAAAARKLGLRREVVRNFLRVNGPLSAAAVDRMAKAFDGVGCADSAAPPLPAHAAVPATGVESEANDRFAALETQVAELRASVARLSGSAGTPPPAAASRYVSPISRERFAHNQGAVTSAQLDDLRTRIHEACEDLGHLACIADDQQRWDIQRALGPAVDELFVTIDGFVRKFPIAALETLASQRKFVGEYHARIAQGQPDGSSEKETT